MILCLIEGTIIFFFFRIFPFYFFNFFYIFFLVFKTKESGRGRLNFIPSFGIFR